MTATGHWGFYPWIMLSDTPILKVVPHRPPHPHPDPHSYCRSDACALAYRK